MINYDSVAIRTALPTC